MHQGLIVAKVVTMILGLAIAYEAYKGYQRHGSEPMLYVSIGFLFISVGAILEGLLFDVVGMHLHDASAIQTGIVAVGMLFVLYSLHGGLETAEEREFKHEQRPVNENGTD
jgi:hypothetical protein